MKQYDQEGQTKYQNAKHIEDNILIGPNYVGIVDDDAISKANLPSLFDLKFVKSMHQSRVL